jgi:hypothetical protein
MALRVRVGIAGGIGLAMTDWQPIETYPNDGHPVQVRTRGGYVLKAFLGSCICEGPEGPVDAWAASIEGDNPPCWTDGICWESNEDEKPSDPPVEWREHP